MTYTPNELHERRQDDKADLLEELVIAEGIVEEAVEPVLQFQQVLGEKRFNHAIHRMIGFQTWM